MKPTDREGVTDSGASKTWLDLLPMEVCTQIAARVSGGDPLAVYLSAANLSKIQPHAVWSVLKSPIYFYAAKVEASDFCCVEKQVSRMNFVKERVSIFRAYDFHIVAFEDHMPSDIGTLLSDVRIVHWTIPANSELLVDLIVSKGEAQEVSLNCHKGDNIKQTLRRLSILPLCRLHLRIQHDQFYNSCDDLAFACRDLCETCTTLKSINFSGKHFNRDHCELIQSLPDCCNIRVRGILPAALLPKLGSMQGVYISYPHSLDKLQALEWISEFTPSYRFEMKLSFSVDLNGDYDTAFVRAMAKNHQSPTSLKVSSQTQGVQFVPKALPSITKDIRIKRLTLSHLSIPKQEWNVILEQLGNDLHELDVSTSPVFEEGSERSMNHLLEVFMCIYKFNNNLQTLRYPFQDKDDHSESVWGKVYAMAEILQAKLPLLNYGTLCQ